MTQGMVSRLTKPAWPAIRSATITPSSMPLCASIGPRTTSPTAYTLGRLVRQCSSTSIRPRSSIFSPTVSAPRSCVLGTRPTDTTSLLQSSACLPSVVSYSTVSPRLPRLTFPIFTPNLISSPCSLTNTFHASLATASSAAARNLGNASSTVTFAPSRRHTLPSSSPITPAPMTPSLSGTALKASAPMLSHTVSLSTPSPGKWRAVEPVAMMTWLASTISEDPPSATSTWYFSPPPANLPWPLSQVILFFLNRNSMPPVSSDTILSLRACILATSIFAPLTEMPWLPNL